MFGHGNWWEMGIPGSLKRGTKSQATQAQGRSGSREGLAASLKHGGAVIGDNAGDGVAEASGSGLYSGN